MKTTAILPDIDRVKQTLLDFFKGRGGALMYISALGIIVGLYAAVQLVTEGFAYNVNFDSFTPWGVQISIYVFLALTSTGASFVLFFAHQLHKKEFERIADRVAFLSVFVIIAGLIALVLEIGRIDRLHHFALYPNPTSPKWWLFVWYNILVPLKILEFIFIKLRKHSAVLMWSTFILGIVAISTIGILFGIVEERPYYHGPITPILFLAAAFLTGSALVAVVTSTVAVRNNAILKSVRNFVLIGLVVVFLVSALRLTVGLASDIRGAEIFEITKNWNIIVGMLLGLVLPFIILMSITTRGGVLIAALLILPIQFMVQNAIVIGGFTVPIVRAHDTPALITYYPTAIESFIVIAAFSLVIFLYMFAEKVGLFDNTKKEI